MNDEKIRISIRPSYLVMDPVSAFNDINKTGEIVELNSVKAGMIWVCEQFVLKQQKLENIKVDLKYKKIGGDFFIGGKYAIEFLLKGNPAGVW